MLEVWTDGSAHPTNPGPGGFGCVVVKDGKVIQTYSKQTEEITTNNREEMKAILWAISNYGNDNVTIITDSAYALNSFTNWIYGWRDKGWKTSKNQTPENKDLLEAYLLLTESLEFNRFKIEKVKGHAGHQFNEMADDLARGIRKSGEGVQINEN